MSVLLKPVSHGLASLYQSDLQDADRRFLIRGVDWSTYQQFLNAIGERNIRVTYDGGNLELMSPTSPHELYKKWFGRFIEMLTEELNIPLRAAGSVTCSREDLDRGLEPDDSYYVGNTAAVLGIRKLDFNRDPSPDLAIEIDITSSSLDRMAIYAALRVGEVWRFDGETLRFYRLRPDATYEQCERSPTFPMIPPEGLVRFFVVDQAIDDTQRFRAIREWIRNDILPQQKGPSAPF